MKSDRDTDFSRFKTYAWEHGWQAYDKTVHTNIVAAVDHELGALGLVKQPEGSGDRSSPMRRCAASTSTSTRSRPTATTVGGYNVGTLVVLLLEPGTRKELFRGRVDKPIETDAERVKPIVDAAVAEMFAKYPTRSRK